jgi:hypothetical protein
MFGPAAAYTLRGPSGVDVVVVAAVLVVVSRTVVVVLVTATLVDCVDVTL